MKNHYAISIKERRPKEADADKDGFILGYLPPEERRELEGAWQILHYHWLSTKTRQTRLQQTMDKLSKHGRTKLKPKSANYTHWARLPVVKP
jgi:hypothetical protein